MYRTWSSYLRSRTRDPDFLWKWVIGLVVGGVVLAYLVNWLPRDNWARFDPEACGLHVPSAAVDSFDEYQRIDMLCALLALEAARDDWGGLALAPTIDSDEFLTKLDANDPATLTGLCWRSLQAGEAVPELTQLAATNPPPVAANYALAQVASQFGTDVATVQHLERELQCHPHDHVRRELVKVLVRSEAYNDLSHLALQPEYRELVPPWLEMVLPAVRGEWGRLWWLIPRHLLDDLTPVMLALALLSGLAWFAFLAQSGQVDTTAGVRWWLMVAGMALGVLTIWPTDFFIFWQEYGWGLEESPELIAGLRYFIVGVGLREELAKLCGVLLLAPWIVRRGHPLEALLASGCVGLGFAMLENAQYFEMSGGGASVPRLLTANFFHIASTGLIGLAACRACWYPTVHVPQFVAVFAVVVLAHGLYDALIVLPDLQRYAIGPTIVYLLLAYQFFHELRSEWRPRYYTVSLAFTFLTSVAILAGTTLVVMSWNWNFDTAIDGVIPDAISQAVMAYMFLREMPESIAGR